MRHSIVFVGVVHVCSASERRLLCVLINVLCVCVIKCISVENNASLSLLSIGEQKHHHRVTHHLKISTPFLLLLSDCTLKQMHVETTKLVNTKTAKILPTF